MSFISAECRASVTFFPVNEDVFGLNVPVDDLLRAVQVLERERRLVEDALDLILINSSFRSFVELQQVFIHVLENHLDVPLMGYHLLQLYYVGMVKSRKDLQFFEG